MVTFLMLLFDIENHLPITISQIFLMFVYFGLLSLMVLVYLTLGIAKAQQIQEVLDRVKEFLLNEEGEKREIGKNSEEIFISLKNVTATWNGITQCTTEGNYNEKTPLLAHLNPQNAEEAIGGASLKNINLFVRPGSFLGIIGPVGSGKSSLLQLILGDLSMTQGNKQIEGKISYAPQTPWIFSSTIRDNILFGLEYDKVRYDEVVKVCGLQEDFQQLFMGDLTVAGDRGALLSGGQKMRINLARCVYRDADIYLLDDPLSAVDVRVGKHILQECFMGFLKEKCKILVTHHCNFLGSADRILVMKNGTIFMEGNYSDLLNSGIIKLEEENSTVERISFPGHHQDDISRRSLYSSMASSGSSFELNCVEERHENKGRNKRSMLLFQYLLSGEKYYSITFTVMMFLWLQLVLCGTYYYLGIWSSKEEERNIIYSTYGQYSNISKHIELKQNILPQWTYEKWYGLCLIILIISCFIRSVSCATCIRSRSKYFHDKLFNKVIKAGMVFYDTNTSGRILNRFTKDMAAIDSSLPEAIVEAFQTLLVVLEYLYC
ncbi:hypothetical protein HHI36_006608 [Cryptolaemus montrouzieri]|uniref:Uncharacterized protein n=1 Tax=Cryptolaemus montrouzieri TaxID=559131 RepID=A0ABD2NYE4_9CUCU